jgi:anti-sigma regulatory factor (Ser/Thr protein kinase)
VEALSTRSVRVEGPDQAGEARRMAIALAQALNFDETDAGRVAIVVTECANNLWKHGRGGEMLIGDAQHRGGPCVEAIALDQGPGMSDAARCFEDGYSTAGSAGSGLGAVARLSECQVFTRPGRGTALLARIPPRAPRAPSPKPELFETGGVAVPLTGETVCGDGFTTRQNGDCLLAMLADGLGHGPSAAECANRAVEAFQQSKESSPAKIIQDVHAALRGTRGAAVSVARVDPRLRQIQFAGVGNVLGLVSGPRETKNFVTMPGIVGHNMTSVREFTYAWPTDFLVLIYSDGIASHWTLDEYDGLAEKDPALISAVIYRDRKRGRDDASVLAIRERGSR